jgi:hypothetical protein
MGAKMKPEQYSKAEADRRFMGLVKAAVNTPPISREEILQREAKRRKAAKAKGAKG